MAKVDPIKYNDEILKTHCKDKKPKYAIIREYGIEWKDYENLRKDTEESCNRFKDLLVYMDKEKIIAPCNAKEIYK